MRQDLGKPRIEDAVVAMRGQCVIQQRHFYYTVRHERDNDVSESVMNVNKPFIFQHTIYGQEP